jgi:Ca2+-transporting ATPase
VVAAAKAGLDKEELDAGAPRLGEEPFTSETRRMTTLNATDDGPVAYAKGASEVILDVCSRIRTERGEEPLSPADREAVIEAGRAMAGRALRVLAVASRRAGTLE